MLVMEQNARVALSIVGHGSVMEGGRIALERIGGKPSGKCGHQGVLPGLTPAGGAAGL